MGKLDGKVALVTGAARGIGQATATLFAEEGADLILCDLDADWLKETAGLVEAAGRRAGCYAADVSKADEVQATVQQAMTDFGHIDVLVNNAGITKDGFITRMSEEDWDLVLNINLKGTFLFTKAVSRAMIKQRSGTIVNIASIIGLIGNAGQCNYAASKAGVIALTKSTAKELAPRKIRANAIAPGFIQTKMTDELSDEIKEQMMSNIPLREFGTREDVARVALFFASDASRYVTGQVLTVCGGMVTS